MSVPEERRGERRIHSRDDSVIAELFHLMRELDARLRDHMTYEEARYRDIHDEIAKGNATTQAQYAKLSERLRTYDSAMPQDDKGDPDYFKHRKDHEDIAEYRADNKQDKRHVRDKLLDYGLLIAIVVLTTHGEKILHYISAVG